MDSAQISRAEHALNREHQGAGMMERITPTCSCGWRGVGYEAHNDWQYTLVAEQERKHLHSVTLAARAKP